MQLPNFDPKNLLPMGLEVSKGAIICGNASAPNLLIAEFSEAQGTYGIVQVSLPSTIASRSPEFTYVVL